MAEEIPDVIRELELKLATYNVRQFQRMERGREQVVRPHTETRQGEATGYIPPAKWAEGQKVWEQRGEAAWRARGAQARAADAAADARQDRAGAGDAAADAQARQAGAGARMPQARNQQASRQASQLRRMEANRQRRLENRGDVQVPLRPPERHTNVPLQDQVEGMHAERQAIGRRMDSNPLFNGGSNGPARLSEAARNDAADNAVFTAAQRSNGYTDMQIAALKQELTALEARMSAEHAQRIAQVKEEAIKAQEEEDVERGRASLVLDIIAAVASVLIGAKLGGVGEVMADIFALKWTLEIAKALIQFYAVEKGLGRRHLAHPFKSGGHAVKKGAKAGARTTKKIAKKSAGTAKKIASKSSSVSATALMLAAVGDDDDDANAQWAHDVIVRALVKHGVPEDAAGDWTGEGTERGRRGLTGKMAVKVQQAGQQQQGNARVR